MNSTPRFLRRGKVRDIYEYDADHLLIVTTDRLSAFDVVLPDPIPGKGKVLASITRYWMKKFAGIVGNHLTDITPPFPPASRGVSEETSPFPSVNGGECDVVTKCEVIPVECIVRGFITGSGWKDYLKTGEVCGYRLPAGLKQCAELPEPLFTPSTKAEAGHDENISPAQAANLIGTETARKIQELALKIYAAGREHARQRGILIADTKFEFGMRDGEILLIDEVMTPDSSRFWPADQYEPGHDQPSFDKQIIRNYLETLDWNKTYPGPKLPPEIIAKTQRAYEEIWQRLTV
jgi:phosphoribosylaminoimidazole-succinocarboxamide synthase